MYHDGSLLTFSPDNWSMGAEGPFFELTFAAFNAL